MWLTFPVSLSELLSVIDYKNLIAFLCCAHCLRVGNVLSSEEEKKMSCLTFNLHLTIIIMYYSANYKYSKFT